MNIAFSQKDWDRVQQQWTLFWQGRQKRPMVIIECWDPVFEPVRQRQSCIAQYPLETTADEIIEMETRHIEGIRYIGDAFPKCFLNFGPGSAAAYFGSKQHSMLDTVWFEKVHKDLTDITIDLDKNNFWYRRKNEVIEAALKKWKDLVQVTFSDISGNLDILASLRGTNELLMDLCDKSDTIDRLGSEITQGWLQVYQDEFSRIAPVCGGSASWGSMWSKGTTYMLQCDFSYMISPDMFRRFVMPDLKACCDFLDDPFYHLDGKGQLPHLDMLLSIEKLKGVQWIPCTGLPATEYWPEVLKKIRDSGKFCQVYISQEGARKIKKDVGGEGFVFFIETWQDHITAEEARRLYDELIL